MSTTSCKPIFAKHKVVKLFSRTRKKKKHFLPQGDKREMEQEVGSMCGTEAVKKKITVTVKVAFTTL